MKIILSIAFTVCYCLVMNAQRVERSVMGTGGATLNATPYTMDLTIGEPYADYFDSSLQLTQGFQQSWLVVTAVEEGIGFLADISVFPNPTVGLVHLKVPAKVSVSIAEEKGQVLKTFEYEEGSHEMDLSALPAGLYYLSIQSIDGKKRHVFGLSKME